jgi:hypothetical protein
MASTAPDDEKVGLLRRQRNLFAAVAVASLLSIGLAVPRKVANYRELKAVNEHLVELQAAIVDSQRQLLSVEGQILEGQRAIGRRQAR